MSIAFVNATRLLVFPGRSSSISAWYLRLPDPDEMLFALHLLRPGDAFLDGGANLGVWSVLAGSTDADVISVEPVADTFTLLERQLAVNRFAGKTKAVRAALAASSGTVSMTVDGDADNKVVEGGGSEVAAITLDELAQAGITLIKLDLEGYELEALRGAVSVLKSQKLLALVIETFRWHNWELPLLRDIERLLSEYGFSPFEYDPTQRILTLLSGLDARPKFTGNNTIYIRDLATVRERLRSAPLIRVGGKSW